MAIRLAAMLLLVTILSGCGLMRRIRGDRFPASSGAMPLTAVGDEAASEVEPTSVNDGVVTAGISASSTTPQRVNAVDGLAGGSVTFPPGTLPVDFSVTVQEGVPLDQEGTLAELGISSDAIASTPAMLIESSVETDPLLPFQVALPVPDGSALLTLAGEAFVVFRAHRYSDSTIVVGTIATSAVQIADGKAVFNANLWGVYQVFLLPKAPEPTIQVSTKSLEPKPNQGSERKALEVVSTSLTPGATAVDPGVEITWTMNAAIDASTLGASATLQRSVNGSLVSVSAVASLSNDGNAIVLKPTSRLHLATEYVATLAPGPKNLQGVTTTSPNSFSFTTRDGTFQSEVLLADFELNGSIYEAALAGHASGRMVAAWLSEFTDEFGSITASTLWVSFYDGAGWTPKEALASDIYGRVQVAFDDGGTPHVAWVAVDGGGNGLVHDAYRDGAGTWILGVQSLSEVAVPEFTLGTLADGVVAIAYGQSAAGDNGVYINLFEGTQWTGPQLIAAASTAVAFSPRSISGRSDGTVGVAWMDGNLAMGAARSKNSSGIVVWSVRELGDPAALAYYPPEVIVNAAGRATFVWAEEDPLTYLEAVQTREFDRSRSPLPAWADSALLATSGTFPTIDQAPDGKQAVAWLDPDGVPAVEFKTRTADDPTWSAAVNVSRTSDVFIDRISLVMNEFSDFFVSWPAIDSASPLTPTTRVGAYVSASGAMSATTDLLSGYTDTYEPTYVGFDSAGHGLVAGTTQDEGGTGAGARRILGPGLEQGPVAFAKNDEMLWVRGLHVAADGRAWLLLIRDSNPTLQSRVMIVPFE